MKNKILISETCNVLTLLLKNENAVKIKTQNDNIVNRNRN
jgi:hypothetical protein